MLQGGTYPCTIFYWRLLALCWHCVGIAVQDIPRCTYFVLGVGAAVTPCICPGYHTHTHTHTSFAVIKECQQIMDEGAIEPEELINNRRGGGGGGV